MIKKIKKAKKQLKECVTYYNTINTLMSKDELGNILTRIIKDNTKNITDDQLSQYGMSDRKFAIHILNEYANSLLNN